LRGRSALGKLGHLFFSAELAVFGVFMHRKAAFGAFVIVSMLGSPFPALALERSAVPVK